ncbi:hypothetical protein GCM10007276_28840 [Agaricicola taiwanensis]|uniref:DUF6644 domain-containing protein n=1 Tax=Agaricicola taiwanensis TaxID=591372 RepID=A0A8J3DYI8_9RHOB|nr:DUF6644 family protein [Agaricicola taiwanensis]GGE49937.1 hypothetical protein GCM10007276_28840 [Agaricicola taiwanensis]
MEALAGLSEWPVAEALRRNGTLYLLVNAAHILALGTLIGSILVLDLRLLGLFRSAPLSLLAPPLMKVAACGLGGALITGFLLFSVRPVSYVENPAFLAKLVLIGLGIANVTLVHFGRHWRLSIDGAAEPAAPLKIFAAASIAIWTGAVIAGRWIGFL